MAFHIPLPRFNKYSFSVEQRSVGKLLPPQSTALKKLQEFFERHPSGRIGLVSIPTGSGKSGVISCLPYFSGKSGLHLPDSPAERPSTPIGDPLHKFDKPVLVIAPDLTIASQLERTLTVLADLGGKGETFLVKRNIVPSAYAKEVLPQGVKIQETAHVLNTDFLENKDIIIANAQKFLTDNWEEFLDNDMFKLVIVDEAHHHPAPTWRRIIKKFKDHAMVAFFTATPYRGDGKPVLDDSEGELVYELTLEQARTERIIRRMNWCPIHTEENDIESVFKVVLEKVKSIQGRKDEETPLPDNIPHLAIAITKTIQDAKIVEGMWNAYWGDGGPAIAYHSKDQKKLAAFMKEIRRNNVKLIVVVEMLREGFDHPPISIAAIMTKIDSRVKFAQFVGRTQRIVRGKDGPETDEIFADIVTHSFFQQEDNYRAYEEALFPGIIH